MLPVPLKSSTEVRPLELSLLLPLPKRNGRRRRVIREVIKLIKLQLKRASKRPTLQKEIVSIAIKMDTGRGTAPNIWQRKRRPNKVNMIY